MGRKLPLASLIGSSPAAEFFIGLLGHKAGLGFPRAIARAIWCMVYDAEDEEAKAFVYETYRTHMALRHDDPDAFGMYERYCLEWLTPHLLSEAVSELERREEIGATLALDLRKRIAKRLGPDGKWRFIVG
jgi:hypothetical protein